MQGDLLISADSTSLAVDSIAVNEGFNTLPEPTIPSDSALFHNCPFFFSDTTSKGLMPVIELPERHAGIEHPKDTIAESFLLTLLFLVILFLCRLIGKGTDFSIFHLKNILLTDDRNYTSNASPKRLFPVFWIINIIILSYAVRLYEIYFSRFSVSFNDGTFFWKIVIYIASFWVIRQMVLIVVGSVFFNKIQIEQWFSGMMLIMTLFSFSLLPLIIISETGVRLPSLIMYCWPVIFWLLPKIVQCTQLPKLFSLRNRGYLYLILYLCALEILPVMLFIKVLFLIK